MKVFSTVADANAGKAFRSRVAVTLIELLCVIAIIGILMAFYAPTLLRAYKKIRAFLFGLG